MGKEVIESSIYTLGSSLHLGVLKEQLGFLDWRLMQSPFRLLRKTQWHLLVDIVVLLGTLQLHLNFLDDCHLDCHWTVWTHSQMCDALLKLR